MNLSLALLNPNMDLYTHKGQNLARMRNPRTFFMYTCCYYCNPSHQKGDNNQRTI